MDTKFIQLHYFTYIYFYRGKKSHQLVLWQKFKNDIW